MPPFQSAAAYMQGLQLNFFADTKNATVTAVLVRFGRELALPAAPGNQRTSGLGSKRVRVPPIQATSLPLSPPYSFRFVYVIV